MKRVGIMKTILQGGIDRYIQSRSDCTSPFSSSIDAYSR